ncbi:MAG: hydroxyacid dehydrogenase [Nitrososphaerota archaeon]|nr:hydroxyacid dehydrogenase [Nitrososphaerota archaeon]MDG6923736.1 hydroxyacid dehydrogenase [Nitrososphaerota archaeon]
MKILVSDPISEDGLALLKQSKVEFQYRPDISPQDLLASIGSYDALIVRSRTKVTKEVLDHASKLRVIGRAGVGVDNIDSVAAKAKGVNVLNTPDALTNAVAEFTIGIMIDLSRKIVKADVGMKDGKWDKSKIHGVELKGRTYGTIGIGRIGQRVSEIAYAFGMKIMANDVIPVPEQLVSRLGIKVVTQEEVFRNSDFVDLHVPLTPETQNLVNYEKIKMMKQTSFLINTSRGKVVNEADLLKALKEKVIAGAALDVFEVEPPTQMELLKHENMIATPHIAGQTAESQTKAGTQIVEQVLRALN